METDRLPFTSGFSDRKFPHFHLPNLWDGEAPPTSFFSTTMQHSPQFLALCETARAQVAEVSVQAAAAALEAQDAHLVDVREDNEWLAGHADGATHLGRGIIERDIEKRFPDPATRLHLYCGGGFRSALAAVSLRQMGYTNVASVAGGWKAWLQARLPVTTKPEQLPRSPYEQLGGLYHLPRLIDKCRLIPAGKLPGYFYLNKGFDKALLDFLCIDGRKLEQVANETDEDERVLAWIKMTLGPGWPADHAIRNLNEKMVKRTPESPEQLADFSVRMQKAPPTKRHPQTYFDLIDAEEGRLDRLNTLE